MELQDYPTSGGEPHNLSQGSAHNMSREMQFGGQEREVGGYPQGQGYSPQGQGHNMSQEIGWKYGGQEKVGGYPQGQGYPQDQGQMPPGFNNQGYTNDQGKTQPPGYYGSPVVGQTPPDAPGYQGGYQYPAQGALYPIQQWTTQPKAPKVVHQNPPSSRPTDYFILAIIATVLFNPIMGAIAIWFSILSRRASDAGDYHTGAKRGRDALWVSLGSIIFTLACVFTTLIIIFTQGLDGRWQDLQEFSNEIKPVV